jgi:hypothetical protein
MSKRSFLHLACAILLLIAQHGALTHSVWHLGNLPGHAQEDQRVGSHSPGQDDPKSQSRLCDLHFAMGALFAADCGGAGIVDAAPLTQSLATPSAAWRTAHALLTPPSRAPPVLL